MCVRLAKIIDHKSQINLKSQNLTKINLFKIKKTCSITKMLTRKE